MQADILHPQVCLFALMKKDQYVGRPSQVVSLITCRFMGAEGTGNARDAIRCVDYCIGKRAHIVSSLASALAASAETMLLAADL